MSRRPPKTVAAALAVAASLFAGTAGAQSAATPPPDARVMTEMVGEWDVSQSMWTGPDAEAVVMPAAVARRSLAAGGGFIEEVMTLAQPDGGEPFTRTAHLNYNAVDGGFEYFSIDSRAPQQMSYRSEPMTAAQTGPMRFQGGTFIAAEWGDKRNAAFRYRIELSEVRNDEQMLRLFLRPLETGGAQEFKAFEYLYRRRSTSE